MAQRGLCRAVHNIPVAKCMNSGFLSSLTDYRWLSHEESGEEHSRGPLDPFIWILAFDISGKTS